ILGSVATALCCRVAGKAILYERLDIAKRLQHRSSPPRLEKDPQRAVKMAIQRAKIHKAASCHTFRHSFATHLLQKGYYTRTVQELFGHEDVATRMIYAHVLNKPGLAARSPLDLPTADKGGGLLPEYG